MFSLRSLSLLLVALGASLQAQDAQAMLAARQDAQLDIADDRPGPLSGPARGITDNARLRAEAMRLWFGDWTPEFRRHLLETAAVERRRHENLLPGAKGADFAAPATGTWLNIGPTKADVIKNGSSSLAKTDSGRPRSILVDPNNSQVIYICASSGGVWKTTNGGTTWTPLSDTLGSLSSGYLAMDPANSQILYLGLGDPFDGTGIGILKSTDGGTTWGAVKTLGTSRTIQNIVVHPQNSQIVLVTTNAGLFRSTDGGATYAAVASIPATYKCWDLAWAGGTSFVLTAETDPANSTGATAGKILRSTDSGATWVATTGIATTSTRISVASAPSNRAILYAMASKSDNNLDKAYKSVDGGATWTSLTTTAISDILGGQGFYNHMILVDRTSADTVYFGGQLYVAKSTNGGNAWTKKSDWLAQNGLPYVHADMHCAAQDSNGAIYVGSDGGIFKSTDGGSTWSDTLNIGITNHLIYSIGSSLAAPSAVIGGFQDNGTRVRSGSTTVYNQYIGGDGFGSVMHPSNGSTMLGSLYYTRIQKSTNGGTTFTSASSGITESNNTSSAPFITRIALGPADATGNTVYTFVNTKVYKSTNFAGSWTAMGTTGLPTTSFVIRNVSAAKSNGNVVGIAANSGRVFLTSNGGSNWTQAAALPNNGSYISSVAFDPTDHNVVYVTSVVPDATKTHVWKSTNFGGAWTELGTGLPAGIPVNLAVVDPTDRNVVYAGTHLGLYRSADGGASWSRWGSGLPLVNVTDVWVAPDASKVRVATFGRGFWELQGEDVATAPSITGHPQNQTVNAGATATFTVTATGTAPLTYQWKKNGTAVSGATSASYTTPATTSTDNGASFTVTVSNTAGTVTSNAATLTVNTPSTLAISTQPASQTVASGSSVSFTVAASGGTAPYTYQWYKNGTAISGATSATYAFTAASADNGAKYKATVRDSATTPATVTSSEATLTVTTPGGELILNGGFESGTANWAGTTGAIGNWSASPYLQPAYEGVNSAFLAGNGKSSTETLYQTVSIPSTATSATLSFYLHIDTKETQAKVYDTLAVQVLNGSGTVLGTLATYSNVNSATGYQLRTFNVSSYKGQTIRVNFKMVEDATLATNFLVDKVSLTTN